MKAASTPSGGKLERIFVGRKTERETFKAVLNSMFQDSDPQSAAVVDWMDDEDTYDAANNDLPHIFLISGHGGIGKSRLLEKLHSLAGRAQQAGRCRVAPIIRWEEGGRFTITGRESVDPQEALDSLQRQLSRSGLGEFTACTAARKELLVEAGDIRDNSGQIALGRDIRQTRFESGSMHVDFYGSQTSDPKEIGRKRRERLDRSIEALNSDLRRLSAERPLVICLDTYELVDSVDLQLRPLYLHSGPHVVWLIAGRDSLVADRPGKDEPFRGYAGERMGDKLHVMALEELGVDDIVTYFDEAGTQIDRQQATAIFNATRGNALALSMAATMYGQGHPLTAIVGEADTPLLRSLARSADAQSDDELVYKMTQRMLLYCVTERDRRYLYALTLARRPDPDLLEAMMQLDAGLRDMLEELESRYDFVFAPKRSLHDTVAFFLRSMLMEEAREGSDRKLVAELNTQACDHSLAALRRREAELGQRRVEKLMSDERWSTLLLDYLHHALWLDPESDSREVVTAFCCAVGYQTGLAPRLRDVALALKRRYDGAQGRWLAALGDEKTYWSSASEQQLNVLLELTERLGERPLAWHPDPALGWGEARAVLYWQLGRYYDPDSYVGDTKKKDRVRAVELYEAGLRASDMVKGLCVDAGQPFYEIKRYEDAVKAYSRAIELDPKDAWAYNNRGSAYDALQQYEQALADYQRAIALDPKDATKYRNLSNTYANMRRYDEALIAANKAIELEPDKPRGYMRRGEAYAGRGDHQAALADYDHAIKLDPKDSWVYRSRGYMYYALQQYERALADYARAIELDPKDTLAYRNLSNTYAKMRRYDDALIAANKAIDLEPNNPRCYVRRGGTHAYKGDYEAAFVDFRYALGFGRDEGWTRYCMACTHALRHEPVEGLEQLKRAIELDASMRRNARTDSDFDWLLANDPAFAAAFRALIGENRSTDSGAD